MIRTHDYWTHILAERMRVDCYTLILEVSVETYNRLHKEKKVLKQEDYYISNMVISRGIQIQTGGLTEFRVNNIKRLTRLALSDFTSNNSMTRFVLVVSLLGHRFVVKV